MKYITAILAIAFLIFASYTTGYKVCEADNEPVSDVIYFSDYKSNYKLNKSMMYRTERITEDNKEYWFIYIWDEKGRIIVEYEDTIIDGEYTTAEHWKNSLIACFDHKLIKEEQIVNKTNLK